MLLHPPSYGYESTYTIQAHEIDLHKQMKPMALLQLMQEASMQNAIQLKISVYELEQENISWVLLKKDLHINRWPALGEKIRIITYPSGIERIFAHRDYIAYDQDDQLIAHASSTWTLMNLKSRTVERIPQQYLDLIPTVVDDALPRPIRHLLRLTEATQSYTYTIHYFDLDWNGHVNNVALTRLMLQSIPSAHWDQHSLVRYAIQIKAECRIGETITAEYEVTDDCIIHRLMAADGGMIAQGCSWWASV